MANDELQRLTDEVSETATVIDSAIVLISGLAQKIRDNTGNPTALKALADSLDSKQTELATAITANTVVDNAGGSGGETPVPQ